MSLINDALKRATLARPVLQNGEGARDMGPPLQPVFDEEKPSPVLPLVLCIVGIGSLLIAGGLWLKAKGTPPESNQVAEAKTGLAVTQPSAVAIGPPDNQQTINSAAAHNPIDRAAATLENIHQRNLEGESEAAKMLASAPPVGAASDIKSASASPTFAASTPKPEPILAPQSDAHRPQPVEAPIFKLHAIYYRLKGPTVVINGKTVKAGDMVDGAKVLSIQRTWVDIDYNGARRTLHVP